MQRRDFIKSLGLTAAAFGLYSGRSMANAMSSKEWTAAKTDKVKVAFIGIGNRGEQDI